MSIPIIPRPRRRAHIVAGALALAVVLTIVPSVAASAVEVVGDSSTPTRGSGDAAFWGAILVCVGLAALSLFALATSMGASRRHRR